LTNAIEAEAEQYIDKIDALGGAVTAFEAGYQQREITEAAYTLQMEYEKEAEAARAGLTKPGAAGRVRVGVNRFVTDEEANAEIVRVDPAVGARQTEKLERLRAARDAGVVSAALDRIRQTAAGDENLMPVIVDAVKGHVTLGEIADSLRTVWGEQREAVVV